jgi:hypothetical protein
MPTAYKVVGGDMTSIYAAPHGHVYEVGSTIDARRGRGIWAYTRREPAALRWGWARSTRRTRYGLTRYLGALVLELSFATKDMRHEGAFDSRSQTIALRGCRVERVVPAEELLEVVLSSSL